MFFPVLSKMNRKALRRSFLRWVPVMMLVLLSLACGGLPVPGSTGVPPSAQPTELPEQPTPTEKPANTPAAYKQPPLPGGEQDLPVQEVVDDACAALVIDAIASLAPACGGLSGSSAYLGHGPVAVHAADDVSFGQAGDIVPLSSLDTIRTAPVNVPAGAWGVVDVRIQPDETNSKDYANITLTGDVTLHKNDSEGRSLLLQSGENPPSCPAGANTAIFRTDPGVTTTLTVNGVGLTLAGAVAVVQALPGEEMRVMVLRGTVLVSAAGASQTVGVGQTTAIPMGGENGLVAAGPPSPPAAFDPALIRYVPISACIDRIDVPAGQRWTSTNIRLEAGQSFVLMASGLVRTIESLPWASPAGHPPADCIAAGRDDWGDCKCRTLPKWGTCSMDETATMILLARVGDGEPFIVGAGGVFTAAESGVLQLGPNDNFFDDNVGSFHAIVIVPGLEAGKDK